MTTYAGGKKTIAKDIAQVLSTLGSYNEYWEPFVGMASVMVALSKITPIPRRFASDTHAELVEMWKALQGGWDPPQHIMEAEYYDLKSNVNAPPHLRAFVGHGYGFSGIYFGKYKANMSVYDQGAGGRAYRGVTNAIQHLQDVTFQTGGYDEIRPPVKRGALIYCDPPYRGTMAVGKRRKADSFDSDAFWEWVRDMSKSHMVVVSELAAPDDFIQIWSKNRGLKMANSNSAKNRRVEEGLFVHKSLRW